MLEIVDHKFLTPKLSDFVTTTFLKDLLENKQNAQRIEDDRSLQVKSHQNLRYGSGLIPNEIISLEFHQSGKYLAYSRTDGSLTIWEIPSNGDFNGRSKRRFVFNNIVGTEKLVTSLSWNNDEKSELATATNSNELIVWAIDNTTNGTNGISRIKTMSLGNSRTKINKCCYSPFGKWLLAATKSECLYLLAPKDDFEVKKTIVLSEYLHGNDSVYSMCWSNSDDYLFVGLKNGIILVFEVNETNDNDPIKLIFSLGNHRGSVSTLKMDPLGRYLVSGSTDGSCIVWDLQTFIPKYTITDVGASILSSDINHLGKILTLSTGSDNLLFYNISNGELLQTDEGHNLRADIWFKFYPNKTWFVKSVRDDILCNYRASTDDELKFWKVQYEAGLDLVKQKKRGNLEGINKNATINNRVQKIETFSENSSSNRNVHTGENKRLISSNRNDRRDRFSTGDSKRFGHSRPQKYERARLKNNQARNSMISRFNR